MGVQPTERRPSAASVVELVHPAGVVAGCLVLGRGAAALASLPHASAGSGRAVDAVVLAPTLEECRRRGWLEDAVEVLVERLAVDGVAVVIVPRRARGRVRRLLRSQGLRAAPFVALPAWSAPRVVLPLTVDVVGRSGSPALALGTWQRRVAAVVVRAPGGPHALGRIARSSALVVRRPGAPPLAAWLSELGTANAAGRLPVLTLSPHHRQAVVQWPGDDGTAPSIAVKVAFGEERDGAVRAEAAALTDLAPTAAEAGALVPRLLRVRSAPRVAIAETVVPGEVAAAVLARAPERFPDVVLALGAWLLEWNVRTVSHDAADANELIRRALLEPAALLAPTLPGGPAYLEHLDELARTAAADEVPVLAAHNDLTTANVLVASGGWIGVVDWEVATARALPLGDLLYAVVDAWMAASGGAREDAARACQDASTAPGRLLASLAQEAVAALGLSDAVAAASVHACWLGHAVNEQARGERGGGDEAFRKIVAGLARDPESALRWARARRAPGDAGRAR